MGKRVNWRTLIGAGAGLMLAGYSLVTVVGCSDAGPADPRPPVAQLKEGVNLLDVKDPTVGMNAAFVKNGRVVYLQTRVGPQMPDVYRQDMTDDEPQREMDLRFVNQEGRTFYIMRGGDNYIDATWGTDIAKGKQQDLLARQKVSTAAGPPAVSPFVDVDWAIAQEAAAALALAAPSTFKDHTYHLALFAKEPVPSANPELKAQSIAIAKAPPPIAAESEYGAYNFGSYSTYYAGKYSGSTGCVAWICAAKHSATLIYSCDWNGSGCSWVTRISANNHGRAYNASGMGGDCGSQGGWQVNSIDGSTAGSATGSWDGQGGCQTGYSWSSSNNVHLCNDDAAYELWEAKYGPQSNTGFSIQQYGTHGGAGTSSPTTFSCNYPNGDWNTPNCP